MAPEIMLCMDYTEQVDVFSYGMILCELISRKTPSATNFKRVIPGFGIDAVGPIFLSSSLRLPLFFLLLPVLHFLTFSLSFSSSSFFSSSSSFFDFFSLILSLFPPFIVLG